MSDILARAEVSAQTSWLFAYVVGFWEMNLIGRCQYRMLSFFREIGTLVEMSGFKIACSVKRLRFFSAIY